MSLFLFSVADASLPVYYMHPPAVHFFGDSPDPLVAAPVTVSSAAVPMAARVSQTVGAKENPTNFLLMHAMGPNVAGVIGTAVAAGTFMAIYGV